MSNQIHLKQFCADDDRRNIEHPWTRDGFTYCTDGRIIIRQPGRADVPENPSAPNAAGLWKDFDMPQIADIHESLWLSLPEFPPVMFEPCEACGEAGMIGPGCDECEGGQIALPESVRVHRRLISNYYLAKLALLPNVRIAPDVGPPTSPMLFRFDGGDGLLMGVREI